jgi:hypothetical protein
MNNYNRLPALCLFLLTLFATGCSKVADHNRFLKEHGITETDKVPVDYAGQNGWKELAGNYVYFLDIFNTYPNPQMIYIVANKKEGKLVGLMHVNPQIMIAAIAKGVNPATIVTNYEEISPQDIAKANDMTEFNALLRAMPEMKDFKWKNTMQNQIASGIMLKTHFIYVSKKSVEDKLFTYSEQPVMQDHGQQLANIFQSDYALYHRDVQRLNRSVEMGQFITALGFHYESKGKGGIIHSTDKFYIGDLIKNDPINFEGKGKMFFFIPMKCYTRPAKSEETPYYYPAIETYEYSLTPDAEGFPVFKRNTHFASLLRNQNEEITRP